MRRLASLAAVLLVVDAAAYVTGRAVGHVINRVNVRMNDRAWGTPR